MVLLFFFEKEGHCAIIKIKMCNCVQKSSLVRERKCSMVNEQRLHSMIKIAKFDANDGKSCKPMIQYARKDYVALQLLKSFVAGTIAFFMMLGLWVLYSMDALMEQINKMDFVKAATTLGLLYGIFMVIYLLATYIIFNMKYTYGRKKVKKYYAGLKKINAMYLREERLKVLFGG